MQLDYFLFLVLESYNSMYALHQYTRACVCVCVRGWKLKAVEPHNLVAKLRYFVIYVHETLQRFTNSIYQPFVIKIFCNRNFARVNTCLQTMFVYLYRSLDRSEKKIEFVR